jgi:Putative auto-transporter adhesin, head GIN domain
MIKFIVLCTKVIVVAIAAILFSSCNLVFDGIKGNGNVQTERRTISEKFTKVSVERGLEVIIEQGENVKVEVEADENLLKHITTKVENGTLIVSSDENIYNAEAEVVRVTMPTIESLETTSGSSISSKSVLKGLNLEVKSSSGSEININAEFDTISSESTSGSTISLSGKALKFTSASSSGSEIEAGDLLANEVITQSTSGSSIEVNPRVSLNAKASSGSSVEYKNTPRTIVKEETSGGSVSAN